MAGEIMMAEQAFLTWLPGELEFEAQKTAYTHTIKRARLPLGDAESLLTTLGQRWQEYRELSDQGLHFTDEPGAQSGQQQLAKFTAGIVDKIVVGQWIKFGQKYTPAHNFRARQTAFTSLFREAAHPLNRHWRRADYEALLQQDFVDTPFAERYIPNIAECLAIASMDGQTEAIRIIAANEAVTWGAEAGRMALKCYSIYAAEHLSEEQFTLPVSQLSPA